MITSKKHIEIFLKNYFIITGKYTISDDGVVDIDGQISVNSDNLNKYFITELPIQFGHVTGNFEFENTKITTLKGFPYIVDGNCLIRDSNNLKSLKYSPKCNEFFCSGCNNLESLDGLNCETFFGQNLNLKKFGKSFSAKYFSFNQFPKPTADEMQRFIQLKIELDTNQEAPWITLMDNYLNHKDIFRAVGEFEALYNEPWVKPEDQIEINQSIDGLSL